MQHFLSLVFVAADFSLDCHARTFGEGAGEISQLPEGDASMPLGPRFPFPASFFQDILVESENAPMLVALRTFCRHRYRGNRRDSVEAHLFLLFCPSVSGARKRASADLSQTQNRSALFYARPSIHGHFKAADRTRNF
jgi:hypothetical protein